MPIREIFYFIKENRGKLTRDELKQKLREQGYAEDQIEEAFFWADSEGAAGYKPEEKRLTLWQALLKGAQRREAQEKPPAKGEPAAEAVDSRGSFITGILIAPAIYFAEILVILFLQLFYPVPSVDPLVPIGIAVAIGVLFYILFKSYAENFVRGVRYGVGGLLVWFLINLLFRATS